jgi:hypothetical protein
MDDWDNGADAQSNRRDWPKYLLALAAGSEKISIVGSKL